MSRRLVHWVLAGCLLAAPSGCFRGGGQLASALLDVAVVAAEVAVVAAVIAADHDAHYHGGHCHPTTVIEGNVVYYYNDNWEYYDEDDSLWYIYN